MTHKWLAIGLTKVIRNSPVSRAIVSGSSGPTERISSFVHLLLQSAVIKQESYIKVITNFLILLKTRKFRTVWS